MTIYGGTFFAAVITAIAEYTKGKQYAKISEQINEEKVVVFRGRDGTEEEVPVSELVVGDIVDVQ